jgi:hypothetical protein
MIASFFQSLESHGAAYLLISGQATVLYGAATFSEDIDLWVEPSAENIARFRSALAATGAHYYKLTPPLEPRYLTAGHGFHFTLEHPPNELIFLDVMGRPPRARTFAAAWRDHREFATDWGALPVVGIRDLIELKKTQRLSDYPIVSTLTLRALDELAPSAHDLTWAVMNLFTLETFFYFNEHYPEWADSASAEIPRSFLLLAGRALDDVTEGIVEKVTRWMGESIARHQRADRLHWRRIIAELRALRSQNGLMPEGEPV